MDPTLCLLSGQVRDYRRSRGGTPDQIRGISEVGVLRPHGAAPRSVAVGSPSFRLRPCRLPLGYKHTRCGSGVGGHFFRPRFLHLYHRGINDLLRLSISDTFIHYAPSGLAVDEGTQSLVEAKGYPVQHGAQIIPVPDQRCDRAQLPEGLRRQRVQLQHRWDGYHIPRWRRYAQQRSIHDAFKPRILEGRSNFYFHPEGSSCPCGVLVVRELHRFLGCLLRRRGILRVPMATLRSLYVRVDSTP